MKILAFGASTSSTSINRQLANYAAGLLPDAEVTDLDLSTFRLPIYGSDEEERNGVPPDAERFLEMVRAHDAIVISMAEHNGSYSAAFKNLLDWVSRIEGKLWSGKPMLVLATSPGGRGAATVLATAAEKFPKCSRGSVMSTGQRGNPWWWQIVPTAPASASPVRTE